MRDRLLPAALAVLVLAPAARSAAQAEPPAAAHGGRSTSSA